MKTDLIYCTLIIDFFTLDPIRNSFWIFLDQGKASASAGAFSEIEDIFKLLIKSNA